MIPFCEIFIIPYLLWFPYVVITVVYFLFRNKNKKEYFQLIFNLMMGMTVFLVVSYIYPNVQYLRPAVFPRSNIFTRLVAELYRTDTPTNILPSIHVFNSLAVYFAIHHCQALKDRKWLQRGALILSVLIILSTMFKMCIRDRSCSARHISPTDVSASCPPLIRTPDIWTGNLFNPV